GPSRGAGWPALTRARATAAPTASLATSVTRGDVGGIASGSITKPRQRSRATHRDGPVDGVRPARGDGFASRRFSVGSAPTVQTTAWCGAWGADAGTLAGSPWGKQRRSSRSPRLGPADFWGRGAAWRTPGRLIASVRSA